MLESTRVFDTGSVRDVAEGKGPFHLLPYYGLKRAALRFEEGAKKYGKDNWKKGQPVKESFIDSALRHLNQAAAGFTNEDHLGAAAWNVLCAIETQEMIQRGALPESLNDIDYKSPFLLP